MQGRDDNLLYYNIIILYVYNIRVVYVAKQIYRKKKEEKGHVKKKKRT